MSSVTVSPLHRSQAGIDDELDALAERMRALRTHRNNLSPISIIPPEILGVIFLSLARQVQALYPPDAPAVLSWLNVGHVCHLWREVALANPELWATPFLSSSEATEEMLVRSKMAPLILRTGRRYRMDCVQKAFEHVERLQEVSLGYPDTPIHLLDLLSKLSSCSAPSLQSFSLVGGLGRRIAIPTSFMAPNLRRLKISRCDLSWASPVLTGLTFLDIKSTSVECLPTLDGLMSALRRMPALHTLFLEDALPTLPRGSKPPPYAPHAMDVRLSHLERLRLTGKVLDVVNVLAHVELPNSTRMEVQLGCRIDSYQELNPCLPIISRTLGSCFKATPDNSGRAARSMRLYASDHILLQYGTVRHPTSWVERVSETPTEVPVIVDITCHPSRAVIKKLYTLVPLGRLEALYIEAYDHPYWNGFWPDVLGRTARNLAYIHLHGPSQLLEDLFKSMRSRDLRHSVSRSVENISRKGPKVFAPALSHLVFQHLKFVNPEFNMTFTQPLDLRDVLIDRVNCGRGLDKLTITGCSSINAHDVQLLREVVVDVEWDKCESRYDYDFHYDYDSFDEDDDDTHYSFSSDGVYYYSGGSL